MAGSIGASPDARVIAGMELYASDIRSGGMCGAAS